MVALRSLQTWLPPSLVPKDPDDQQPDDIALLPDNLPSSLAPLDLLRCPPYTPPHTPHTPEPLPPNLIMCPCINRPLSADGSKRPLFPRLPVTWPFVWSPRYERPDVRAEVATLVRPATLSPSCGGKNVTSVTRGLTWFVAPGRRRPVLPLSLIHI